MAVPQETAPHATPTAQLLILVAGKRCLPSEPIVQRRMAGLGTASSQMLSVPFGHVPQHPPCPWSLYSRDPSSVLEGFRAAPLEYQGRETPGTWAEPLWVPLSGWCGACMILGSLPVGLGRRNECAVGPWAGWLSQGPFQLDGCGSAVCHHGGTYHMPNAMLAIG